MGMREREEEEGEGGTPRAEVGLEQGKKEKAWAARGLEMRDKRREEKTNERMRSRSKGEIKEETQLARI